MIKLSSVGGLTVTDFFTPSDQPVLNSNDLDLGEGSPVLMPDQAGPGPVHLMFEVGKEGVLYLVDRDKMGQYLTGPGGADAVVQEFALSANGFWSTPAFWNNTLYACPADDQLMAYTFNPATKTFIPSPAFSTSVAGGFGFPGLNPAISALGTTNGIVWAIDATNNATFGQPNGPAVLHAYDATNFTELYKSSAVAGDMAGNAVKFTVPVIANGKVYIGTQTRVDVYGLLPN